MMKLVKSHFVRTSARGQIHPLLVVTLFSCLFLMGCNRDPQKFMNKGNQSFQQGKYPEALIYYGRAAQLNRNLAEAHYKLAQTHVKMKSWSAAYAELQRTVELQPEN